MSEIIEFDQIYRYSFFEIGIAVPVRLYDTEKNVKFIAKIDTGSTNRNLRDGDGISRGNVAGTRT